MASNVAETIIGAAVLAAAGGFLVYAAQTADIGGVGGDYYEVSAPFRKADGLGVGADVRVSGVKVGTVTGMELDQKTYRAVAKLTISDDFQIPEDSTVTIATEGLLGGSFVSVDPGASDFFFEDGSVAEFTQGSVSILELVGRAIAE